MKCTFTGCPFEGEYHNCCLYHAILVDYWFYELGGVKHAPAELSFTMTGARALAPYPQTADPDAATYRARYQKWAEEIGQEERDRIVADLGGGEPWDVFVARGGKMKDEKGEEATKEK